MITLLGALLGFFSSTVPEFLKLYRDQHDRKYELAILDRQIESLQKGQTQRLEEVQLASEARIYKEIYRHADKTGLRWVDALGGTVRPVITYAFFLLYAGVKVTQLLIVHQSVSSHSWTEAFAYIWHLEDQALFATVISFWFGQRMLSKQRSRGQQ